jgi:hypothetical protein
MTYESLSPIMQTLRHVDTEYFLWFLIPGQEDAGSLIITIAEISAVQSGPTLDVW